MLYIDNSAYIINLLNNKYTTQNSLSIKTLSCFIQIILYNLLKWEAKMLKRYQVLLPDWLENYITQIAELFDLSFSEMIRLEICFSILSSTKFLYPKYKMEITPKEILESAQNKKEMTVEERHRLFSKMYFETRKAAEYRLPKLMKQKKE
jgi:hypothetical protein